MSIDLEFFRKAGVDSEKDEKAQRAVKSFRALQPTLTAYARMLTKNKNVRVEMAANSNGSTDGRKIFFRPPIALGENFPHQRRLCDKRDSDKQLLCYACKVREQVLVTIYHEISHLAYGTFENPSEHDKADLVAAAVKETGGKYAEQIAERIKNAPSYLKDSYLAMARVINPFLPLIVNGLEDARVNSEMFKARKGTKIMFSADSWRIFTEGVEQKKPDGTVGVVEWRDYPQNMQAIVGVYCLASGLDYEDWFIQPVLDALANQDLINLCKKVQTVRNVSGIYHLSFPVLDKLRELGFCISPIDPEPEPEENEESNEPTDEADDNESTENGESSDQNGSTKEDPAGGDDKSHKDSSDEDNSAGGSDSDSPSTEGDESDESSEQEQASGETSDKSVNDSSDSDPDSAESGEPLNEGTGSDGWEGDLDESSDSEGSEASDTGSDSNNGADADGSDSTKMEDGGGDTSESSDTTTDSNGGDSDQNDSRSGESTEDAKEAGTPATDGATGEGEVAGDDKPDYLGEEQERKSHTEVDDKPIDSGADDGTGGIELIEDEKYDHIPMGDPDDCKKGVKIWTHHSGDDKPSTVDERDSENAVDRAIVQGIYFETPSKTIFGVREHHYGEPVMVDGRDISTGWNPRSHLTTGFARYDLGIDGDFTTPQKILSDALVKMRVAFADNARGRTQNNLKSGKVNVRVLGKRAYHGDDRIFKRRTLPGKKSYLVVLGMDISGSTIGTNIVLEKKAVMAQATLLNRMGIPFAIYAHSANFHKPGSGRSEGLDLDVYIIKDEKEVWEPRVQERLNKLGPDSANLDGHALEYLRKKLDQSDATDKIILYYSDGKMPAENHDEELIILQREIKICKNKGYTLLGVGIRTDSPARHGLDTVQVDSEEDVVKVVKHIEKRLINGR